MVTITPKGAKAWVTFNFKPDHAVDHVAIAGDWNDWEPEPMRPKKDGSFYIRKYLLTGSNYQFRYLVDDKKWVNDDHAPRVHNPYGTENSLLELETVVA
ncbi:MAG TPA: hypothetical protein ENK93_03590 [Campylobacteraceae bacterium]|nr:hypothetical protein [Campylobacteraceae bacterium]